VRPADDRHDGEIVPLPPTAAAGKTSNVSVYDGAGSWSFPPRLGAIAPGGTGWTDRGEEPMRALVALLVLILTVAACGPSESGPVADPEATSGPALGGSLSGP
jgi:hypothetical protein